MIPNQLKPHGPERGALSSRRRKCKYHAAVPKLTPSNAATDADAQKMPGLELASEVSLLVTRPHDEVILCRANVSHHEEHDAKIMQMLVAG